jgi:nucleotide-binding universal stress UspA family protein
LQYLISHRVEGTLPVSFQRILIAVDGEPISAHAADIGVELARSLGAELALVHGVDPAVAYASEGGIAAEELISQAKQEARRLLSGFRQRLALPPSVLEFVGLGRPAAEVVKTAKQWPADLIVLGSHGRVGVQRVLLGSVAEAIMRHAPCPVLVIRAHE